MTWNIYNVIKYVLCFIVCHSLRASIRRHNNFNEARKNIHSLTYILSHILGYQIAYFYNYIVSVKRKRRKAFHESVAWISDLATIIILYRILAFTLSSGHVYIGHRDKNPTSFFKSQSISMPIFYCNMYSALAMKT